MTERESPRPCDLNSHLSPRRSTDRRGALRRLGGAVVALVAGARLGLAQRKMALGLDKFEKLKTAGGSALLKIQGRDYLFIRDAEDSVKVLDPTCTHQKCTVAYNRDKQRIICPCHSSNFDLNGRVLNGPAEKPLQVFEATLDPEKTRIIFSVE